jgi:S1-C subfamily serine protease
MKYLLVFLLLTATTFADEVDKKLHEKCLYPTVLVANGTRIGTGCIIKSVKIKDKYENYVLTCYHVITQIDKEQKYNISVKKPIYDNWSHFMYFRTYKTEIVASTEKLDLAVLMFKSDKLMHVAELDLNPKIYIGSDVFKFGCSFGEQPRLDYGKITATSSEVRNQVGNYRTSIPTLNGDSGSPIFHDYKLIGIVQSLRLYRLDDGSLTPVYHFNFAVPTKKLPKNFLDNLTNRRNILELKVSK